MAANRCANESSARSARSLLCVSREQPVVLIIEDWHWADEDPAPPLKHLARSLAEHAILFIVTYRPSDAVSLPASATNIKSPPLSAADSARFAESCSRAARSQHGLPKRCTSTRGATHSSSKRFVSLFSTAAGRGSRILGSASSGAVALPIPDTIQAVLSARIDSCAPPTRRS